MSRESSNLERAAIAYVLAVQAHERTPIGTPESVRRAADVTTCFESLEAAVQEQSIPSDQRQDVARFDAEGGA